MSKYLKWYNELCLSRKNMDRKKSCGIYYESHHITPKWMGGDNSERNLVLLTAREHYIAHYLLFIHYKDKPSSAAFHLMNNSINSPYRDSRKYAELREFQSNIFKGENNPAKDKEVRAKISKATLGEKNGMYGRTGERNPFYGKTHSDAFKEYKMKLHGTPIHYNGVTYPSIREASRQTGVSRYLIKKSKK
jgi:hypothetical protein